MIRKLIAIIFLFSVPAQAVDYYFTNGTGASCGSGSVENLSETPGASDTSESNTSAQSWSFVVTEAGSYATGDWSSITDILVGAGGGGPNRISATIEHYNSACTLQATILTTTNSGNLTAGALNGDVTVTASAVAGFSVAVNDEITVTIVRSSGGRTSDTQYNNSGANYDSRLTTPAFTAGGGGGEPEVGHSRRVW